MGGRYLFILTAVTSLSAWAEPVAPFRERPVPPIARVVPPRASKPRFAQRRLARPSGGQGTPLVLSPTRELSVRMPTASFEFEPGVAAYSVWPDATAAWLVRDLNGDGLITTGRELFGSFTVLPGGRFATNGFEALAALDSDGDQLVTPRDAAYGELRLWFDRDGNRQVDPGELETLKNRVLPLRYTFNAQHFEAVAVGDEWLVDLHLSLLGRTRVVAQVSRPR